MSSNAAIDHIKQDLRSSQAAARREALKQLGKLGADAIPAIPDLVRSFRDSDKDVRWTAAEIAGDIGCEDPSVIKGLSSLLQDPYDIVVLWAHYGLARLGVSPDEHFSALLDATNSPDPYSAARALGKLGTLGLPALARLNELLTHPDDAVRWVVGKSIKSLSALQEREPEKATGRTETELITLFHSACSAFDTDNEESFKAAYEELKKAGAEVVPVVEKLLDQGQLGEGVGSEMAILLMTELGVRGVPTITLLAQVDDNEIRSLVADALGRIGSEAAAYLIQELHNRDLKAQARAADGLALMGPSVARRLTLALREADPQVPPAAAMALSRIGRDALPEIQRARASALRDGNMTAVRFADEAIKDIEGAE